LALEISLPNGLQMLRHGVSGPRLWILAVLLLEIQPALGAQVDLASAVQDAIADGADASAVIDVLQSHNVPLQQAIVVAINNSPQIMAGALTIAAMSRAESDHQEEIGYIALTAATGVGSCTVAEAIGMPQPSVCAEMLGQ
jgi:hypothetical protein